MLPYAWRISIGVVRAALGISCLILYIVFSPSPEFAGGTPIALFVVYSLFALWRSMSSDFAILATLIIDLVAFSCWIVLTPANIAGSALWLGLAVSCYVFLLTCAVLRHDWIRVGAIGTLCLALALALPSAAGLRPVFIWGGVLALLWSLNRRYLEQRLSAASRQSVMFRYEAQRAREEERERIAADFHDGPLQSFIGFLMRLEILKKMIAKNPQMALDELAQLQELTKQQVNELRAFVRSMRPADIDGGSLGASISRMSDQFQRDTGIAVTFLSGDYLEPKETEVSLELLQVVREALNNIRKHSQATRIAVAIGKKGEDIEITIDDNGTGFPFSGSYTLEELDSLRLGPVSIRRRVRSLGGELWLESRPGQGSGLRIRVAGV